MGLHIDRRDDEQIMLDYPDRRRITLTREGMELVCRHQDNPDAPLVFMRRSALEIGTTIGVGDDVSIDIRAAGYARMKVRFIVNAPADVVISRGEEERSVEDVLRGVLA